MNKQIELNIEGMSCNHCVMTVTNALSGKSGVKDVKVNLDKKEALLEVNDDVNPDNLISAVKEAGYDASLK